MIIEKFPKPFEAIYIEDTYTSDQLEFIWKELDFVTNRNAMKSWDYTKENYGNDVKVEKVNNVFYPTLQYKDPLSMSPLMVFTKSQLSNEEIYSFYESINPVHALYRHSNFHTTFASYYQDADKYDYHRDAACYTTLTYLYKEPKSFSGGEITLMIDGIEETKDIKNNMSIIFPSTYLHKVSPIEMSSSFGKYSTYGRYCVSQFMYMQSS